MTAVGSIESVWRYPVKSMRGESLQEVFVGYAGVYGDRLYAVHNSAAIKGFPYLTGRERSQMLLCRPRFRDPELAAKPPNQAEAESLDPGLTAVYPDMASLAVDVETPDGRRLPIDGPELLVALVGDGVAASQLSLLRSDRAMTDCRPISLISLQSVRQLGSEVGIAMDQRRFRANLYADLGASPGFTENDFVGRRLRIGARVEIVVLDRDPRCKMITLDPDTGAASPEVLRQVARAHDGRAGVYGAVLTEGTVRAGDEIVLVD